MTRERPASPETTKPKRVRKKPAPKPAPPLLQPFKVGDFVNIADSGSNAVVVKVYDYDSADVANRVYDLLTTHYLCHRSHASLRRLSGAEEAEMRAAAPPRFAKDSLVYATSDFAPIGFYEVRDSIGERWVRLWCPDGSLRWDFANNYKKFDPGMTYDAVRITAGRHVTYQVKPILHDHEAAGSCGPTSPSNECATDGAPRLVTSTLPAPEKPATTHRVVIEDGVRTVIYTVAADTFERARAKAIAQHMENNA